jgi:hypothetical protein
VKLYTSSSESFAGMRGLILSHVEWSRDFRHSFSGIAAALGLSEEGFESMASMVDGKMLGSVVCCSISGYG